MTDSVIKYVFCALVGYLAGTFNPAYLMGRMRGIDIHVKGSGNAGASNALILFGKMRGAACALVDIAKATLVIRVMMALFPGEPQLFAVTGSACILGHIYPFYMRFCGGKGLACLGGTVLAFDWRVFLIMLACEAVVAFVTNYICFVPITAAVVFPLVYGIMTRNVVGALILLIPAAVILLRHRENLARIRAGRELRLSFLWNKQAEEDRLRGKYSDEDACRGPVTSEEERSVAQVESH